MAENTLQSRNRTKALNKQIRRENLKVLYGISNLLTKRDVIVNKFIPSQYLDSAGRPIWQQYQLDWADYTAELLVSREGEASLGIVRGAYFISDTYIDKGAHKRVKARLNLLKKQWEQSLQRQ